MEKFGRICKEYMIDEMVGYFKEYPDFFVASFANINVGNIEKFRKSLKKDSAVYMIVKNRLLKRALDKTKDTDIEKIKSFITGTCGILFCKDEPSAIARMLVDFGKDNDGFKLQGGFVNGEPISVDIVKQLAVLPSRDVLLSMVAAGMNAPISGFVRLFGNLLRNLVGAIDAVSKKKGKLQ